MKKIFKRALSAILATVMTATSVSFLSICSFAEGPTAGTYKITTNLSEDAFTAAVTTDKFATAEAISNTTVTKDAGTVTISITDISKPASFTLSLVDTKKLIGNIKFSLDDAKLNTELSKDNQSVIVSIPAGTLTSSSAIAPAATIDLVDAVVWIGGKDTKEKKDKNGTIVTEQDLNKTATLQIANMWAGGTWVPFVTAPTVITAVGTAATDTAAIGYMKDGVFATNAVVGSTAETKPAYVDAKGKVDTTYKNTLAAKFSKGKLTVTAGKQLSDITKSTEIFNVWVAEIDAAKKVTVIDTNDDGDYTDATDVKPFYYTVAVKNSSAKMFISETNNAAVDADDKVTKTDSTATVAVGETKKYYFNAVPAQVKVGTEKKDAVVDEMAHCTVALKDGEEDYATVAYNAGDEFFTLTGKALKDDKVVKVNVTVTDTETGKANKIGVTVNNAAKVIELGDTLAFTSSASAATTKEITNLFTFWGTEETVTDAIAVFATDKASTDASGISEVIDKTKGTLKTGVAKYSKLTVKYDKVAKKITATLAKGELEGDVYIYAGIKGTDVWDFVKVTISKPAAIVTAIENVAPTLSQLELSKTFADYDAAAEASANYDVTSTTFNNGTKDMIDTDAIAAGSYTIIIVLTAKENYKFKDGFAKENVTAPTGYTVSSVGITGGDVAKNTLTITLATTLAAS